MSRPSPNDSHLARHPYAPPFWSIPNSQPGYSMVAPEVAKVKIASVKLASPLANTDNARLLRTSLRPSNEHGRLLTVSAVSRKCLEETPDWLLRVVKTVEKLRKDNKGALKINYGCGLATVVLLNTTDVAVDSHKMTCVGIDVVVAPPDSDDKTRRQMYGIITPSDSMWEHFVAGQEQHPKGVFIFLHPASSCAIVGAEGERDGGVDNTKVICITTNADGSLAQMEQLPFLASSDKVERAKKIVSVAGAVKQMPSEQSRLLNPYPNLPGIEAPKSPPHVLGPAHHLMLASPATTATFVGTPVKPAPPKESSLDYFNPIQIRLLAKAWNEKLTDVDLARDVRIESCTRKDVKEARKILKSIEDEKMAKASPDPDQAAVTLAGLSTNKQEKKGQASKVIEGPAESAPMASSKRKGAATEQVYEDDELRKSNRKQSPSAKLLAAFAVDKEPYQTTPHAATTTKKRGRPKGSKNRAKLDAAIRVASSESVGDADTLKHTGQGSPRKESSQQAVESDKISEMGTETANHSQKEKKGRSKGKSTPNDAVEQIATTLEAETRTIEVVEKIDTPKKKKRQRKSDT